MGRPSDRPIDLRPPRPDEAAEIYAAIQESAAELEPWLPEMTATTLDGVRQWIERQAQARAQGTAYHFAILERGVDVFLGVCGLTQFNRRHGFANLYYWVRSTATGRGLATAAARQLARLGLEQLGLQRVEIVVARDNLASLRVAEKAGARREGLLRNRLCMHDQPSDAFMFSLVAGSFAAAEPDGQEAR
jgi:RimJ/RimL family protein N-acetyltransferase